MTRRFWKEGGQDNLLSGYEDTNRVRCELDTNPQNGIQGDLKAVYIGLKQHSWLCFHGCKLCDTLLFKDGASASSLWVWVGLTASTSPWSVWLLRLGGKQPDSLHLNLLGCLLRGTSAPVKEGWLLWDCPTGEADVYSFLAANRERQWPAVWQAILDIQSSWTSKWLQPRKTDIWQQFCEKHQGRTTQPSPLEFLPLEYSVLQQR